MQFIRQNATHKVVIGPFVAVGDGFTPVTNFVEGSADEAEAILHDNGTVVDISAYTLDAITTADGYYHLTLQSGITSTVGHLTVIYNDDSLILPVKADFTIVEEAVYDALYDSGATGVPTLAALEATVATVNTDLSNGTDGLTALKTAIDAIPTTVMRGTDSAFLAASAPSNFSSLVITAGGAADSMLQGFLNNTIAETTADNIANNFEVLFDNANSTSTSIIDDVENLNATVGNLGAGLTDLGGMSTTMKGQVNTEADTALTDYGALKPTTAGRTLDVTTTGEAGMDLGNVIGTLGNANVGWVDGNNRIDVGSWLGTAVTLSSSAPDVNIQSSDNVALTAQQKLDVNTQVDVGLNTAIPGSPTADSINERVAAIDDLTQASGGGDLAAIKSDLPSNPTKGVALSNLGFLMVDSADNVTPKTGLTVSGTISKDGGAFSALTNSVAEIANGIYKVTVTSAEMNADIVVLRFTASGGDDRFLTIATQPT